MKKVKVYGMFVLVVTFFIISCEEQDKLIVNGEEESFINHGYYHNEGLRLFINKNKKQSSRYAYKNFKKLLDDVSIVFHKKHPNIYNYKLTEKRVLNIEKVDEIMSRQISFTSKLKLLYHGNVSMVMENLFDKIIENDLSYEFANNEIAKLKSSNMLVSSDLQDLKDFESVMIASYQFWSSEEGLGMSSRGCNPRNQVYFADGVGWLMFGGLGGIGYSWLVGDMQAGACL